MSKQTPLRLQQNKRYPSYQLYDKEQQLIVVGSLPKHLPTLSYR